jgi:hypothetical protein
MASSNEVVLTADQEDEALQIEEMLRAQSQVEFRTIARFLASRKNTELLGQSEFVLRDAMHRIGARGIEAALNERKKGGIKDRA